MQSFSTRLFLSAILLVSSILVANAQDPQFSQFYAAPLQNNPALTGVFEGKFRVGVNYREQWNSILGSDPFRTVSASFDMRQQIMKGDYLAFGVTAMRDEADNNFEQNRGGVNISFLKQLAGNRRRYRSSTQYLIAGAYAGVGQNSLETPDLWFSNQFVDEIGVLDRNLQTGEDFSNMMAPVYLDFSAGVLWYGIFDENQSIYFGGSVHHLNSPNIAFMEDGDETLYRRFAVQAGGELPFSNTLSLLPAIIGTKQGPSTSIQLGGNFRYSNEDWKEIALRIGGWGQIANKLDSGVSFNAFIVTAILELEKLQIGASYDLTANQLNLATQARGAFELSVIYIQPEKNRRLRVNCPKF